MHELSKIVDHARWEIAVGIVLHAANSAHAEISAAIAESAESAENIAVSVAIVEIVAIAVASTTDKPFLDAVYLAASVSLDIKLIFFSQSPTL